MPQRSLPQRDYYRCSIDEALAAVESSRDGLTTAEATRRLATHGPNELPTGERRTLLAVLLGQLTNVMIVVLLGAAVVSLFVGERQDALVIGVIVLMNAAIGAVQEIRAERAVEALRELAEPAARARRDGSWITIPAHELLPGDLLHVEAGNVVTADARLLEATDLAVEEAALTGESLPVDKHVETLPGHDVPIGDRDNMLHRGTLVTRGHGVGVVVATGLDTELGRIAQLLQREQKVQTPLQRRLDRFGKQVAVAVLAICAVVFFAGIARGEPAALMLLTAVSLGVAAIPEALPAVVSVSLALGAQRMARRRALVRRLPAVETLGSVTFACADKTGTLTEGRMRVESLVVADEQRSRLPDADPGAATKWQMFGQAMALSNDADGDQGDPTEVALAEAARAAGFVRHELEREAPRLAEVPFDADRRRSSTLHADGDGANAWIKGAPEAVAERCIDIDRDAVLQTADELAAKGLRVLAFARRRFDEPPAVANEQELEHELNWLGLVGLMDGPRAGAAEAVQECRAAGIHVVMITGDHPVTAHAIARRIGIVADDGEVLIGREVERLPDQELAVRAESVRVYARASPEQKIRIVRALQQNGEFVAMTGDGVNDAPALKRAEIGIAMGRSGTEVAREAADMVLLDDDFSTIVAAAREGRRVFDNIRKFVRYTMTSNAGEIWTLLLAPFLGLPLPLLPIQILWINLVTDGLPGLALGVEPEEGLVMRRPPRAPDESIFAHGLGTHVVWVGLMIGGLSIGAQSWAVRNGSDAWQSVVFTTLTLCQLAHVLAIRSERDSLFRLGWFSNPALLASVLLTLALQMAVLYVPFLQGVFHTQALSATELAVCCLLPLLVWAAVELEKLLPRYRRGPWAGTHAATSRQ